MSRHLYFPDAPREQVADITVVMDRSGSMQTIRDDAVGGLNHFIEEQKAQPGYAVFTLIQFDADDNDWFEVVHDAIPIQEVPVCNLVPRGGTALLDAVGRAIGRTYDRLHAVPEDQRPGLVTFVIVTDGHENSSREFNKAQVAQLTATMQGQGWQFIYIGANQDAFAEGRGMGFQPHVVANYADHVSPVAYRASSDVVKRMRAQAASGQSVNAGFTEQERREMAGEEEIAIDKRVEDRETSTRVKK